MGHAEEVEARQKEREKHDPCTKEAAMSTKCMHDNSFERDKCLKYFENVQLCKTFWYNIKKERAMKGIRPLVPPPEERAAIVKNYRETGKVTAEL